MPILGDDVCYLLIGKNLVLPLVNIIVECRSWSMLKPSIDANGMPSKDWNPQQLTKQNQSIFTPSLHLVPFCQVYIHTVKTCYMHISL